MKSFLKKSISAKCDRHTQRKNLTHLVFMIIFFSHFSIDFEITRGQLVAVVGHVGSGKSSLIGSLLGESTKLNGRVVVNVRRRFVCFVSLLWVFFCFVLFFSFHLALESNKQNLVVVTERGSWDLGQVTE